MYYIFLLIQMCASYTYYSDYYNEDFYWRQGNSIEERAKDQNLTGSFFMSLEQYQVGASDTTESEYPWIARVVHSKISNKPHVCTAVCIDERIFITAVRCVYSLKIDYTALIYQNERLQAIAIVLPSNLSKQAFDDIGFIITDQHYQGPWHTVQLFDETNRTDDYFNWFTNLSFTNTTEDYKVVGYSYKKDLYRIKSASRIYSLTELPVTVGIDICTQIMTTFGHIRGYSVPCYHSCSVNQFKNGHKLCHNYHGVEGGAVINTKTKKLLGIAIWGSVIQDQESPVGFSVPNSMNFFEDYTCAKRIRDDNTAHIVKGHYQNLCRS